MLDKYTDEQIKAMQENILPKRLMPMWMVEAFNELTDGGMKNNRAVFLKTKETGEWVNSRGLGCRFVGGNTVYRLDRNWKREPDSKF